MTIFETERLLLREFRPTDAVHVRQMLDDVDARRFFHEITVDPDFPARWIERNQQRYRTDGIGLWAVETREAGEFVGDCGLTIQYLEGVRYVEVGYHLVESARGNGYATEAARTCMKYAFDTLDVARVVSIVDCENAASKKVAGRIHSGYESGFQKNGRPVRLYSTERTHR